MPTLRAMYGKSRASAHGRAPQYSETAGTGPQCDADSTLFNPHRAELPGLDQTLHQIPSHGSARGSKRSRGEDRSLFDRPGGKPEGKRFDPESSDECAGVSLPASTQGGAG